MNHFDHQLLIARRQLRLHAFGLALAAVLLSLSLLTAMARPIGLEDASFDKVECASLVVNAGQVGEEENGAGHLAFGLSPDGSKEFFLLRTRSGKARFSAFIGCAEGLCVRAVDLSDDNQKRFEIGIGEGAGPGAGVVFSVFDEDGFYRAQANVENSGKVDLPTKILHQR